MKNINPPIKGRAVDYIVSEIETMILSNTMKNGETLNSERDLMSKYSVSRTVIREAILILANKGLLTTKPKFRPIVRRPTFDTALDSISGIVEHLLGQPNGIKNLFDTRIMIESILVRESANFADKHDIKALRNALQENFDSIGNSDDFYKTDVVFHSILYSIPKNPIFPAIHKAYVNWLSTQWEKMEVIDNRNELNYLSHKKIFEAIRSRDPDSAEKELRIHLHSAWKDIERTFTL